MFCGLVEIPNMWQLEKLGIGQYMSCTYHYHIQPCNQISRPLSQNITLEMKEAKWCKGSLLFNTSAGLSLFCYRLVADWPYTSTIYYNKTYINVEVNWLPEMARSMKRHRREKTLSCADQLWLIMHFQWTGSKNIFFHMGQYSPTWGEKLWLTATYN